MDTTEAPCCAFPGCFNDATAGRLCAVHRTGVSLAAPPPAPVAPVVAPSPRLCRWPGCKAPGEGKHGYCARDRYRITALGAEPTADPATLAALWAERQGIQLKIAPEKAPRVKALCKAHGCDRPSRTHGWCDVCRNTGKRLGLDIATCTPDELAVAKATRVDGRSRAAKGEPEVVEQTPTERPPALDVDVDRDIRAILAMEGESGAAVVGAVSGLVVAHGQLTSAVAELGARLDAMADRRTVLLAERDTLREKLDAAEAQLAALAVPMTEEELDARVQALVRSRLDREWALARAPRGAR